VACRFPLFGKFIAPARKSPDNLPRLTHRGAFRGRHERGLGCGGRGSVGRVRGSQGGFAVSDHQRAGRPVLQCLSTELRPAAHMSVEGVTRGGCVRRSRVVLASVADVKPAEIHEAQPGDRNRQSAGDGDKRNSSPGRARRKPLKPSCRECRVFRWTCGDHRVRLLHTGCGCTVHPAFPAPSTCLGRKAFKTRTNHVARTRRHALLQANQ
jgi:hypothetical protein